MQKDLQEIMDRAERRKKAGRNPVEVEFQLNMEIMFLLMKTPVLEHPGQLLPMQIDNEEEWNCYFEALEALDLPPDASGIFITPTAFRVIGDIMEASIGFSVEMDSEKNIYSVLVANPHDQTRMMQAYIPGAESVGIDVYQDGGLLADYNYKKVDECMEDLSRVAWTFFSPAGKEWPEERIRRYTENWASKILENPDMRNPAVHAEYSYLHTPGLLGMTILEAMFSSLRAAVPNLYSSLEKAVEVANEINLDIDPDHPVVTESGVLEGDPGQCRDLLDRIELEMDMGLDALMVLEGIEFSMPFHPRSEYRTVFDKTAREIFHAISSVSYPG